MTARSGADHPVRVLGAILAPCGAGSSPAPPGAVDWDELIGVAGSAHLLPALWPAARERELVSPVPDVVADVTGRRVGRETVARVLEAAYDQNRRRNADLLDQTETVVEALADRAIPVMPLKGIDGLIRGLWSEPGVRVMADVDLMIPADRVAEASALLDGLGYAVTEDLPPDDVAHHGHHLPPFRREDRFGAIEVHVAPLVPRWERVLATAPMWAGAGEERWRGQPISVMSATDAMILLVAHAQLSDQARLLGALPLQSLFEYSTILEGGAPGVDWSEVVDRLDRGRLVGPLGCHSHQAHALFGAPFPPGTGPTLGTRAHLNWCLAASGRRRRLPEVRRALVYAPQNFELGRLERLYGPVAGPLGSWRLRARHARRRLAQIVRGGDGYRRGRDREDT